MTSETASSSPSTSELSTGQIGSTDRLMAIVKAIKGRKILVIGDLMLDRFVRGTVDRISRESPVPILAVKQENRMLGGAGNTLANLGALGINCEIIATFGNDAEGKILCGLVEAAGAAGAGLIARSDAPTSIKTRFLSGHQQLLRVDVDPETPVPEDVEEEILQKIEELAPQQHALILSDYGRVVTAKVAAKAIGLANKHGIPVLVDPRGRDFSKYRGATLVTPNRQELADATGNIPVCSDGEIVCASEKIIGQCGIGAVIATRSEDGMSVISGKKDGTGFDRPVHLRTRAKEVFDVSGAGDTVIATIAAGLATGATLVEAASLANIAGGIVVGKVGTAAIRTIDLVEALTGEDYGLETTPAGDLSGLDRARRAPVCDWDKALEQIERWRARGLKVGFTNGCFDILHAGHVNYLNDARNQCDRLVLGLNTDRSVNLLKGPTRPVNHESSRATVLAALGAIDMVVFFGAESLEDDQTAGKLIRHIKPDIYFKGADYTLDRIPEVPVVRSYGGEIKLIPLTEGHSTTLIIERINNKNDGNAGEAA